MKKVQKYRNDPVFSKLLIKNYYIENLKTTLFLYFCTNMEELRKRSSPFLPASTYWCNLTVDACPGLPFLRQGERTVGASPSEPGRASVAKSFQAPLANTEQAEK